MKIDKLKGKIRERNETYRDCAEIIGISKASFNSKMNGKSRFYIDELVTLGDYLHMTEAEKLDIFLH